MSVLLLASGTTVFAQGTSFSQKRQSSVVVLTNYQNLIVALATHPKKGSLGIVASRNQVAIFRLPKLTQESLVQDLALDLLIVGETIQRFWETKIVEGELGVVLSELLLDPGKPFKDLGNIVT